MGGKSSVSLIGAEAPRRKNRYLLKKDFFWKADEVDGPVSARGLEHVQDQALQIHGLWYCQQDGVILSLSASFENPQFPARVERC